MNNRLNTQELAELISQYTSKDKKEVEAFLREFWPGRHTAPDGL